MKGSEMETNWIKEINNIAEWIKNYNNTAKTNGFVIGVSGGVDSAAISCLCKKAVGKENITTVFIPCEDYEYESIKDVTELITNLEISFKIIPILKPYNNIMSSVLTISDKGEINKLVKGNLKARLRANVLYTLANKENKLVAGTGNKSELQIGFATKGGDLLCDLEICGNFYKTEIYEMVKYMPEIPQSIIKKPPSAGLWEGQTDEGIGDGQIGMEYNKLDQILQALENGNMSNLDIFSIEDIEKIQKMIKMAEHKNILPPKYKRN
jgi:NAD+ synthase